MMYQMKGLVAELCREFITSGQVISMCTIKIHFLHDIPDVGTGCWTGIGCVGGHQPACLLTETDAVVIAHVMWLRCHTTQWNANCAAQSVAVNSFSLKTGEGVGAELFFLSLEGVECSWELPHNISLCCLLLFSPLFLRVGGGGVCCCFSLPPSLSPLPLFLLGVGRSSCNCTTVGCPTFTVTNKQAAVELVYPFQDWSRLQLNWFTCFRIEADCSWTGLPAVWL